MRLFATAFLLALSLPTATAQGVAATTKAASRDAAEEIKRLRSTVDDLMQRVNELEKQRLEILKDKAAEAAEKVAEEAKAARVEQRLASLEKAKQGESAQRPPAQRDEEQPLTVVAPFVVKDRAGKTIMVVQEEGSSTVAPAVPVPGGSRGLYIYGASPGAALAHVGVSRGLGSGRIYIARPDTPRPDAVLGYEDGPFLALNNAADGQVAKLDKRGFVLFNGEREAVTLTGGEGGGKVRVLNSAGAPVVGLLADAAGGRVIVASAANGKTVASMASDKAGGTLRVFPASGGKVRGELVVDGIGAGLHLWDAAGEEVLVNLTSNGLDGTGRVEIGNGKGDIVVTAGATDSKKLGFVSTGPYDGGVAGTMGGGLKAASSLLGKESDR